MLDPEIEKMRREQMKRRGARKGKGGAWVPSRTGNTGKRPSINREVANLSREERNQLMLDRITAKKQEKEKVGALKRGRKKTREIERIEAKLEVLQKALETNKYMKYKKIEFKITKIEKVILRKKNKTGYFETKLGEGKLKTGEPFKIFLIESGIKGTPNEILFYFGKTIKKTNRPPIIIEDNLFLKHIIWNQIPKEKQEKIEPPKTWWHTH